MSPIRRLLAYAALAAPMAALAAAEKEPAGLPHDRPDGKIEQVGAFDGPMPTGVTVSHAGRVFVNFPRWGDDVPFTVAEVKQGKATAYPDAAFNRADPDRPADGLVSVQSVVVDPKDRLWILDTGSVAFGPSREGGPKLVGVDLNDNKVFAKIVFPRAVVPATSYLNDVRFDLRRGKGGLAFITDSAEQGPNGIVVVDLETGKSWRRLKDHPSVKPEPNFLPVVEGRPLMTREPGKPPKPLAMGSDGIAIGHDGKDLFYCPLSGRRLYRVSVDALADPNLSDEGTAKTVMDLGDKGGGSDGLESDADGGVYVSEYEHNAILRRGPDGRYETVVHDPRILWPDTLSVAADGYLYFTANQLHRQARFHDGKDLREKPYSLFRVKIDAKPVLLK